MTKSTCSFTDAGTDLDDHDNPQALIHPYTEVAARAAAILAERALPQYVAYQRQAALYCRQELSKLLRYYHETAEQLRSREEAAADEDRRGRLAAKIQATLAEKEHRSVDLIERYRVYASARLDSAAVRIMPKVRARLQVQHMRENLHQDVFYNLASSSVEPIVCPICHARSATVNSHGIHGRTAHGSQSRSVCPRHVD